MSGFISGAAILIIISQIKSLLGIDYPGESIPAMIDALVEQLPQRSPVTMLMGLTALIFLLIARRHLATGLSRLGLSASRAAFITRLVPLLIVILATVIVILFHLDQTSGVAVVGRMTEGIPGFTFFVPDYTTLTTVAIPALLMAVISMVQGIAIAE